MFSKKREMMMLNLSQRQREFLESINDLSTSQQDAILWLMKHIDSVDSLVGDMVISPESYEKCMKEAMDKNDDFAIAVLMYKRLKDDKK